ncbi:MAG: NAD(P)-dependent oxidoreductase [Opitutales bacterium]
MEVHFYEAFAEEAELLQRYLPKDWKAVFYRETIQEAGRRPAPATVISVRTQSKIPAEWAGQLSAILTRSTGYDQVKAFLQANAARLGDEVQAGSLPLYCNRAVAEHAMLLWTALLKKLSRQIKQFRTFDRDNLTGAELESKVLAVFGVGNIGHEITRIGKGLDMRVLGVDIERKHADVVYRSPEEALGQADVVVCAMDLTADNRNYFTAAQLKLARPGLIFVNISRGELSPCTTLLQLLNENHLGGVGLDVFDDEANLARGLRGGPYEETDEVKAAAILRLRDNVIFTPHNAFNTVEAVERKARQSIEQLEHYRINGRFLWPVL